MQQQQLQALQVTRQDMEYASLLVSGAKGVLRNVTRLMLAS